MKASDLFVKALEAEGVEYIFGVPGEENLDFLNSMRDSSIKLVLTRHEQPAGFMAATYGRLTGKAGVCLSTLGPGATNLVTPAAYAELGGMPMLMITGQKPIKASKQGQFQIVNIVNMMRPLTKYTKTVISGDSIPAMVREAFRVMERERPGAAHLELPEDIAREETDAQLIAKSYSRRPIAEEKAVNAAVEVIEGAKHPVMVLGSGANRKRTTDMLCAFSRKTGIPFVTTQMGKGVIDERDPLFLGSAALSADDFVHRALANADVIINIGHDVVEKPPFFMHHDGQTVIHINFESASIDTVYFPQYSAVGDIANTVWQMKEKITPQSHWDFSYFDKIRGAVRKSMKYRIDDTRFPICPERVVADVRRAMPSDGVIALDNGVYKIWFARNYEAHEPNTVLLDNALATMGAGMPSAMAAKLLFPERKVVAICGDGGFMMNSQELETAVRMRLNIVIMILRDDAYGMIKWKQDAMDFPSFGLDFNNPDFVKYAQAYGAHGHRVEKTEDLVPQLQECLSEDGVHLLEVPMDYSDNDIVLTREIKNRSKRL